MSKEKGQSKIEMIAVDDIFVMNPRIRNKKVFDGIIDNIAKVGLKRPITVILSQSNKGKTYDLVCGQGRLEAFVACEQSHIPAIIIDATEEQALIMSLVENLARRQHHTLDLLQGVEILKKQGYDAKEIAAKTGLGYDYINDIINLMDRGEERLLTAVETGRMPISVAIKISETPDDDIQQSLHELYETKQLRGAKLLFAQRLIQSRRLRGKNRRTDDPNRKRVQKGTSNVTAQEILKVYHKEVDRKRLLTRKAEQANDRLLFVMEALKRLFQEEHFNTLLRAEGLTTLPKPLAELMAGKDSTHGETT
ncbi:MAG: chromosome partitioning protein ParB [Micavibrio sp.]|nr:MAG: chromosome partitioning protein ParB [Micavibrio sp.]